MGKNRLITIVLAVSLLGLPLSACSAEERPGPEEAVQSLADGLSRLDVTGNEFAGSTVEAVNGMLLHLVSGMDIGPSVTVEGIEEVSGNEARATLHYVWDVNASPEDYTYNTTVTLERGPDSGWETRFRSTTVHPDLQPGQRLIRESSSLPRADILGSGGDVLVRHWPVWRVGLDKSVLGEHEYASAAGYLAVYLGLDPAAYTAEVLGAGPKAFIEAVTVRQDKVIPAFEKDIATVPGAAALSERRVLAPSPTFAAALLGAVGEATPEMAADAGIPLAAGDLIGISGLQLEYDSMLRGADAVAVRITDADKNRSKPLFEAAAVPGVPLKTTLDAGVQALAEASLSDQSAGSALVAVQPSTGNVLAVANGPRSKGAQTALLGEFSLGSAFTPAARLAALRSGSAPDGGGSVTAGSEQEFDAAARSLGLGVEPNLGTPAFSGTVAREPESTGEAEQAAAKPGNAVVSPFALAVTAASIARGERVEPTLVLNAADAPAASGGTTAGEAPSPDGSGAPEPLTAAESKALQTMMRGVAEEVLPDTDMLALAGTAESGGDTPRPHAWIAAVRGDIAVALLVEGSDPQQAAPVLQAFLDGL